MSSAHPPQDDETDSKTKVLSKLVGKDADLLKMPKGVPPKLKLKTLNNLRGETPETVLPTRYRSNTNQGISPRTNRSPKVAADSTPKVSEGETPKALEDNYCEEG